MVTYRLVSKNDNNDKKVVLEKHSLSEIDNFIYNSFNSEFELSRYFEIENSKFYITYTYKNNPKILDIILRDENRNFSFLLHNVKENNIDTNSTMFRTFINDFINNTSISEIKFLFENNYIDKYTFDDLMGMKKCNGYGFDNARDMAELYIYVKQELKRYINFRKLYSGMIAYNNKETIIKPEGEKIIANTSSELVNNAFNNGGFDELYSCFDLDDLYKIDGIEQLGIDVRKNRL